MMDSFVPGLSFYVFDFAVNIQLGGRNGGAQPVPGNSELHFTTRQCQNFQYRYPKWDVVQVIDYPGTLPK